MNGHQQSELMTEDECAEYLRTTVRHLRTLRAHSDLPFVKVGRLVRFDRSDIEAWLVEHKQQGTAA